MRTHEDAVYSDRTGTLLPSHSYDPISGHGAGHPAPQMKLAGLIQEHLDLDGAIAMLIAAGTQDQLLMTRLKKRKLQLKDEIARIEA